MLAILPAGGEAVRFGGVYKELLPVGEDGKPVLIDSIERSKLLGADRFLIISNPSRLSSHADAILEHLPGEDVTLVARRTNDTELWDSIYHVLPFCDDQNLLVLPDTLWKPVQPVPRGDFAFGMFTTDEPERYSIVCDDGIKTKMPGNGQPSWAWGLIYWRRTVANFWMATRYARGTHYDLALADAMREFGYSTFTVSEYQDIGTWKSYQTYINHRLTTHSSTNC